MVLVELPFMAGPFCKLVVKLGNDRHPWETTMTEWYPAVSYPKLDTQIDQLREQNWIGGLSVLASGGRNSPHHDHRGSTAGGENVERYEPFSSIFII